MTQCVALVHHRRHQRETSKFKQETMKGTGKTELGGQRGLSFLCSALSYYRIFVAS